MLFIKITHTGGSEYINITQVYRIVQTSATEITFYDVNSILPITYTFSSAADATSFLAKFDSLSKVIDIDKLAPQG